MAKRKHPSKQEYNTWAANWQQLNEKISLESDEKRKDKLIKEQKKITEKIFKGLNYLLIYLVGKYCRRMPERFDDCLSEAKLSILRLALPAWNAEKSNGSSFASYASLWVRNAVQRTISKDTPVAIPYKKQSTVLKYKLLGEKIPEELESCNPTFHYGDTPVEDCGNMVDGAVLFDVLCVTPPEHVNYLTQKERKKALLSAIANLPDKKDRHVAKALLRLKEPTLQDIGVELGVSREAARNRRNKVLQKLKVKLQWID